MAAQIEQTATGQIVFQHDCAKHAELPSPGPDGTIELVPLSYRSEELVFSVLHNYRSNTPLSRNFATTAVGPTPVQITLKHKFLGDYLIANSEIGTAADVFMFLRACMADLDEMFFFDNLTRASAHMVDLHVEEIAPFSTADALGWTQYAENPPRCEITIYRSQWWIRRNKGQLLDTLVHEMVHAYIMLFYGHCPEDEDDFVGPADDPDHGWMFDTIYGQIVHSLREWHPSLANLGLGERSAARSWWRTLGKHYVQVFQANPWFRAEWEQQDRPVKKGNLTWPNEARANKRASLREEYPEYKDFVYANTPSLQKALSTALAAMVLSATAVFVMVVVTKALVAAYQAQGGQAEEGAADTTLLTTRVMSTRQIPSTRTRSWSKATAKAVYRSIRSRLAN